MSKAAAPPLILTLELDDMSFAWFNWLRRAHFPPDRNHVPAHVTLFHALPGTQQDWISQSVQQICSAHSPVPVRVTGVRSLGRGVAFTLESPELSRVHRTLAGAFEEWLTPQDRQAYRPHLTVQNKVSKEEAAVLLASLRDSFSPRSVTGTGLVLWRYLGGPWEAARAFPFRMP